MARDSGIGTPIGTALGSPAVAGRWYRGVFNSGAGTSVAAGTLNLLMARRVFMQAGSPIVRLGAQHWTLPTASELLRLGLYADNNGRPGALLIDAGTIDLSTATAFKSVVTNLTLPNDGYFWEASVHQGPTATATLLCFPSSNQSNVNQDYVEHDGVTIHTNTFTVATLAAVNAGLPNPFGAATMITDDGNKAMVAWRY